MAHVAINIEGGLVSGDLLERIAATPEAVDGQRSADFGVEGRLSEEIQGAFSDAATYWNAFQVRRHRGKESATTITRETWVVPLLEELCYDLRFQRAALQAGGNSYTISHRQGADENAPPVHIVASDQKVDERAEAKQSPHAIVQDYLNRSDSLWGIVTNGRRLRLLRNTARFSKPSYIEFDVEAMMEGGLYSEFVLFYRLVHASRLPRSAGDAPECLLERYGGRVREKLRDGVKEALEILGTGLLAHPVSTSFREKFAAKQIEDLGYYRELLRLIYRLLFLMVAEERRLLFVPSREDAARQEIYTRWYSIARLRERADARFFDDGECDLWEGLKQTFRLFEDAKMASELGLTALDGELFGRFACQDLIETKGIPGPHLRNAELMSAIWRLSTFEDDGGKKKRGPRRRVNFAGLDVEEFGSVYEALLDYHPLVTIEGERSRFELVAGSERKSTGSYYTPPELVRELIKSALEPVIADRLAKAITRDDKERALLSLKVCDPASGSGHFMLAAARRIGRELAKVRSGEAEPNPADYRKAVRDVIRRCIYAVDKNPLAVDLCKVGLWIEGHSEGLPLSFLDHHVKCGDSLVGVLDLDVLEAGVPDGAYTAVTGDDKKVASAIKKRNKAEAKKAALFRHNVKDDIARIASAFAAIADLPETTPDEVHAKEVAYEGLRHGADWGKAKWACDLWATAFFAPLRQDGTSAVPTTRHVWDAIGGPLPRGQVAALATDPAVSHHFFHWPLEFPEVFAQSGFDVMLGNPPWNVLKLNEQQFFLSRDPAIARAAGAARKRLIAALYLTNPKLNREYEIAKTCLEKVALFVRLRTSTLFKIKGKLNTYLAFAAVFISGKNEQGRSGALLPTNIIADTTNMSFVKKVLSRKLLVHAFNFYEIRKFFPGTDSRGPFGLFTFAASDKTPLYVFRAQTIDEIKNPLRQLVMDETDVSLMNPLDGCIPGFMTASDLALTRKLYEAQLVDMNFASAIEYAKGMYNMTTASHLFREVADLHVEPTVLFEGSSELSPLIEGKNFYQFDPIYQSYFASEDTFHTIDPNKKAKGFGELVPRYCISRNDLNTRIAEMKIVKPWHGLLRDMTLAANERTIISCLYPRVGVGDTCHIVLSAMNYEFVLLAQLNSLCLDFVARCKLVGGHLTHPFLKQLPLFDPDRLEPSDRSFIASRVGRLQSVDPTYSSILKAFLGERLREESPKVLPSVDDRRLWQAELDAYFAYLYGLTRRELEYILDPKAVMGEDYPSETFRVLKESEYEKFGEYRTQRLVLEAWDRFVADGTFDVGRLREPQYIDRVADELAATREKLERTEQNAKQLLALASATTKAYSVCRGCHRRCDHRGGMVGVFSDRADPGKGARCGRHQGDGQPRWQGQGAARGTRR